MKNDPNILIFSPNPGLTRQCLIFGEPVQSLWDPFRLSSGLGISLSVKKLGVCEVNLRNSKTICSLNDAALKIRLYKIFLLELFEGKECTNAPMFLIIWLRKYNREFCSGSLFVPFTDHSRGNIWGKRTIRYAVQMNGTQRRKK